jgi:hypothetical protein
LVFFLDDLFHGEGFVVEGLGVHRAADLHAHGADLAGHGAAGGPDAGPLEIDVAAEAGVHLHGGGGGDGVLVGGEEDELPAFLFAVEGDQIADVSAGVFLRGVFFAVGEDDEDDFGGALGLRQGLEAAVGLFDRAANGIEQGRGASRGVSGGSEFRNLLHGDGGDGDFILIIKLNEREPGLAGNIKLVFDELIEGGNGRFLHGLHGAGAVEDVGEFGGHRGRWEKLKR